jgi:hypothetical protein
VSECVSESGATSAVVVVAVTAANAKILFIIFINCNLFE